MKEKLIKTLEDQLSGFESQKDSDEYQNISKTIEDVKNADLSKLEDKAQNLMDNFATCWLSIWAKGSMRRIYLNASYKNGYRPTLKDNFINF